ncbi:hypothetical protein AWC22_02110 [Mycobacterium riyadhense]|uniref:Uncharacterized protein n=1 Tax=Mycobacterium riyadhense TaxID=486698 RepID=A0A1X2BQX5_9MYCO|nr:hypothetical protein AWC22_02110 [Mycobacterium riyadhense]
MHQRACRSFINLLRNGHQSGAGFTDIEQNGDVVSTVTSQTIQLVHDDEIHARQRQVPKTDEHALQTSTVGRAS